MAKKRMFNKQIVSSPEFNSLTNNAKLLYYISGMEVDDFGFIDNMSNLMLYNEIKMSALEELIKKKFLLKVDKNIYLQKGFRINNSLRADRISKSRYEIFLKKFYLDENFSYTKNKKSAKYWAFSGEVYDNQMTTKCQPNDNQMSAQDSIGKYSKEKDKEIIHTSSNISMFNSNILDIDQNPKLNQDLIKKKEQVKEQARALIKNGRQ